MVDVYCAEIIAALSVFVSEVLRINHQISHLASIFLEK
jgi:hypothetical protein